MSITKPLIEKCITELSWHPYLRGEFDKTYMQELFDFLTVERLNNKIIYPAVSDYFAALNRTPFDSVKVVILGQDPYHGPGQAHGLSFSVPDGVRLPPSLVNILKELANDLQIPRPKTGLLVPWAKQGVLLLNSVLTVEKSRPASHQRKGWETFTDNLIRAIDASKANIVFVLWGAYAQQKGIFIDRQKHLVIESPHPSPFSAHRGFFGSRPFSKINDYLLEHGETPIDWSLQ